MINYGYKIKAKPENFSRFGFHRYESEDGVVIWSVPVKLGIGNEIPQSLISALEKIWARPEHDGMDFEDMSFDENGHVVLTDEISSQLCSAQLCFYPDEKWLFLNAPDKVAHYNATTIRNASEKAVSDLLGANLVYKRRLPKQK